MSHTFLCAYGAIQLVYNNHPKEFNEGAVSVCDVTCNVCDTMWLRLPSVTISKAGPGRMLLTCSVCSCSDARQLELNLPMSVEIRYDANE